MSSSDVSQICSQLTCAVSLRIRLSTQRSHHSTLSANSSSVTRWWVHIGFLKISLFLERILTEHIDMKNSLDYKPQIYSICSIRVRSRKQDISSKNCSSWIPTHLLVYIFNSRTRDRTRENSNRKYGLKMFNLYFQLVLDYTMVFIYNAIWKVPESLM